MESTIDPATHPTDQISSAELSQAVSEVAAVAVSQVDVAIDKVVSDKSVKQLLKLALRKLIHLALGCLKRPAAAKAPSTSSAPPSDEPPPLEPSPDAV